MKEALARAEKLTEGRQLQEALSAEEDRSYTAASRATVDVASAASPAAAASWAAASRDQLLDPSVMTVMKSSVRANEMAGRAGRVGTRRRSQADRRCRTGVAGEAHTQQLGDCDRCWYMAAGDGSDAAAAAVVAAPKGRRIVRRCCWRGCC